MAQRIRFGVDGYDMDKYVYHDSDTKTKKLRIFMQGKSDPIVLPLESTQATSFLAWFEANSADAKIPPKEGVK